MKYGSRTEMFVGPPEVLVSLELLERDNFCMFNLFLNKFKIIVTIHKKRYGSKNIKSVQKNSVHQKSWSHWNCSKGRPFGQLPLPMHTSTQLCHFLHIQFLDLKFCVCVCVCEWGVLDCLVG